MRFPVYPLLILLSSFFSVLNAEEVKFVSAPTLTANGQSIYFSWRGDIWRSSINGGRVVRITSDDAQETSPVLSTDGLTLYYASNKTGVNQVYRMLVEGSAPLQLTYHSEGSIPIAASADGTSVYTSGQRDAWWRWANRFFKVSSTRPQTGEERLFNAYGASAAISSDGKQILFTREGMSWSRKQYQGSRAGQIWLWSSSTGDYRKLIGDHPYDVRYPLWSPDNETMFFVSEADGTKNLWQYNFKTEKSRQLTNFKDDGVISPAISADGSVIVFRRLFDLYRFDPRKNREPTKLNLEYSGDLFVDDETERRLQKATDAAFSSSGKTIAFIAGGDVWVMDDLLKEPVQITDTGYHESDVLFDEKRQRLLFVSATNGQVDIYQATREDPKVPWWRNRSFEIKQLTNDNVVESDLKLSPKQNNLSYLKHRQGLMVWDLQEDGSVPKPIVDTWSSVSYNWSPNESWIVYSASDNNFNYDVHLVDVADPTNTINVSKHPDNEFNPVWSPDGKTIAFVGRRFDHEYDIYYVSLTRRKDERTARDDKLEQALRIQENKTPEPAPSKKPNLENGANAQAPVGEDLASISKRIRKVSIPSATETQLVWSPDSKYLGFQAEIDGKQGIYTITPYASQTPKFLIAGKAEIIEWRKADNRFYWLKDGTPGWAHASGNGSGSITFSVNQLYSRSDYHREIFRECWRIMRDDFYDGNFNNKNWDEIQRKYIEVAAETVTKANLSRSVAMMLGELNASHLGYRGPSDPIPNLEARHRTGHLGTILDHQYRGPGIKVLESVIGGPANAVKSQLLAGDIILTINGVPVDPAIDITKVLNGTVGKETHLKVRRGDEERKTIITPITYSTFRSLLYERWITHNQQQVSRKSNGNLGYLHIRAMDMTSFHRFERELYEVAAGKQGIVIDVRENGGGFTTDHLLTILTQPRHAITRPRGGDVGYPQDRSIYATWDKPIIVLCNQNSHSNAEIFSHAIKHLGRGKLVGVPTSGSVISTGSRPVMDAGTIRIPFRGWYLLANGQDMELYGAVPDYLIWPAPGQLPSGVDNQLTKAITLLKREVAKQAKLVSPTPIKASERGIDDEP